MTRTDVKVQQQKKAIRQGFAAAIQQRIGAYLQANPGSLAQNRVHTHGSADEAGDTQTSPERKRQSDGPKFLVGNEETKQHRRRLAE